MPRFENQKLKLLYIHDMLVEESNEEHPLTVADIISRLESKGIKSERKSVYSDLALLEEYGMDIICERGKSNKYYLASRDFELAELKLLADTVAASKFISANKSSALIKNIEKLAGKHDAHQISRQVFVENRIKSQNESIYYNIDAIHRAISSGNEISFLYFKIAPDKTKHYRNSKERYVCSPYGLTYNDGNYYLVGYFRKYEKIVSFRVDRMEKINICDSKRYEGPEYKAFDMAQFCRENFSMFSGKSEYVTLSFDNSLSDVVFDRFGNNVTVLSIDDNSFSVRVKISMSAQFSGWLAGLGDKAKILSPDSAVTQFSQHLKNILKLY